MSATAESLADGKRTANLKKAFAAAAGRAKLKDVTPHALRHTFAAWLVQAGVPLRTVCELCRHKDIRTTMRYAHLAAENTRDAVKHLDHFQTENRLPPSETGAPGHKAV